jgi:cell division septation protein DedD
VDVADILTKRRTFADNIASGYGLQWIGENRIACLAKQIGTIQDGQIDTKKMAIQCVISTEDEDRSGDLILTEGIDTSQHQPNPVVLYSHGMSLNKPIGKAEDETGKYTVTREPQMLRSVTYFSQTLPEAYELFGLAAEGILRGWSIGAVPVETEPRTTASFGNGSLLVKRCELFEYSLTPTPDNRLALTERVLKSETGGKQLLPTLLKCFQPWLLPMPRVTVVPEGVPVAVTKEAPPPSKADKPHDYEPLDDKNPASPTPDPEASPGSAADSAEAHPTDDKNPATVDANDGDKYAEYPHGAAMLAQTHDRLMEMTSYHAAASKKLDSPAVKDFIAETASIIEERCDAIKDMWKAEYPDLDEPTGDADTVDDDGKGENDKKKPVEKNLPERLGRYLRAFRAQFTKGVKDAGTLAELANLKDENAQLKKALQTALRAHEKLKSGINAAKRGR